MRAKLLAITAGWLIGYTAVPAGAAEVVVNIDNFAFSPAQITVPVGTRVVWTNRDDIPHTVTDAAEARQFRSPPLDTGERFARVFDHPGTYRYFCSLHAHMQGILIVQ